MINLYCRLRSSAQASRPRCTQPGMLRSIIDHLISALRTSIHDSTHATVFAASLAQQAKQGGQQKRSRLHFRRDDRNPSARRLTGSTVRDFILPYARECLCMVLMMIEARHALVARSQDRRALSMA